MEARNAAEVVKRRAKRDSWMELGKKLENEVGKNNNKFLYGIAKSYRKNKSKIVNIKGESGEILTGAQEINDRWTNYFESLLNAVFDGEVEEREEQE